MTRNRKRARFPGVEIAEALPRVLLANDLIEFTRRAWRVLNPAREPCGAGTMITSAKTWFSSKGE